jgi:hypothetical protein
MRYADAEGAEAAQIAEQLSEAEGRLVEQYAGRNGINEDRVRRTFGQVRQRFAEARMRTFVPILVERAVRRELDR